MKRINYFLHLMTLSMYLVLASCGKDNVTSKKATSNGTNSESLVGSGGKECSCNSVYMPVSGINSYGATVTYDNICLANCHGLTNIVQGRYPCTENLVCMDDNRTSLSECNAQAAIRNEYFKSIVKFQACNAK